MKATTLLALLALAEGCVSPVWGQPAARCAVTAEAVTCPMATATLEAAGLRRQVDYQLPPGTPPAQGWPVVFLFEGSFAPSSSLFQATSGEPFGAYYGALLVAKLLDAGYAVLAPETLGGASYWETNVPPWATSWSGSPDDQLMVVLFEAVADGTIGPLDPSRLYAAGISSGGYMTSRMAISYRRRFKALAIHSASYATCGGPICTVPVPLPADHPPTLFLHGALDTLVPPSTMQLYLDTLTSEGRPASAVVDPSLGHQWIPEAPAAVVAWFAASP